MAVAWGSLGASDALAQYVYDGENGTAYAYAGTNDPPWILDSSKTGKWITNGENALFSGSSSLNSTQDSLTVENATVSFSGAVSDNSSIVVNDGGIVNMLAGLWLSNGNYVASTLLINPGGTLNISGQNSFLADNKNANASVVVDNGTLNAASSILYLGHHGAITMELKNNARLESNTHVVLAGGDKGSASTNVTAERSLTIGTAGSLTDQSLLHAQLFTIGRYSNGRVVLESGSITTDSSLTVGFSGEGTLVAHGGTIQSGGTVYVGQNDVGLGILELQNTTLNASGQTLVWGNYGTADVKLTNSAVNASSIVVGQYDGSSGNVVIKDSTLTLTSANPFYLKRGSITLDNATLNTADDFTQKAYVWGSQSVDSATEIKNMTLAFDNIFRINSASSGNTTMIIGQGALLELNVGFWTSNVANSTVNLEIRDGGKLAVKGTSYLTDHRSNAYTKVTVDGGVFEGNTLNLGWWGPLDLEIANGGTVSASGTITFNSNSNASDPADSRSGDLAISGAGSALTAVGSITFGNASRDKVTVNLKASETGFGKIVSAKSIIGVNVEYLLDASAPIILQSDYSPENGFTLMAAGEKISGFSGSLVSGDWTATLSDDQKTVTVKQSSDALGVLTGTGDELEFQTPAESGWVQLETETGNPLLMTMTLAGVADMDSMVALADVMNESFTTFRAEAVSEKELLLTNLGTDFTNAIFVWDFSSLASAGFTDLAVAGLGGQNVPEPGACLLMLLGAAGIFVLGKRNKSQTLRH